MSPPLHTKDILAAELKKAGLTLMAAMARSGYYDDYLSPLDAPCLQLLHDLAEAGTPAALALRERAMAGEFDATSAEAEDWAKTAEAEGLGRLLSRKP